MTNHNISKIADVVDNSCAVVVVSAIGAVSANDTKITDILCKLHYALPDITLWNIVCSRYKQIVCHHCIDIDIDNILDRLLTNIMLYNSYHYTISIGEQLSAMIMAKYLHRQYLDAEQLVIFDNSGTLDYNATITNIATVVKSSNYYVMGGFYGSDNNGCRMTFDRGGSDITGSLVCTAIGADIYENWTDVCGLCQVDPRLVDCARSIRCISYADMQLLADCGVRVLNNHSIYPVMNSGIPINIRSIYNMYDCGTVVSNQSYDNQILSIIEKVISDTQYQTTVISTCQSQWLCNKISKCTSSIGIELVDMHTIGKVTVVSTHQSILKALYKHLVD